MTNQTMSMPIERETSAPNQDEGSPFIREFFMVESATFRGMAYHDDQGFWRAAFDHEVLTGEVRILD